MYKDILRLLKSPFSFIFLPAFILAFFGYFYMLPFKVYLKELCNFLSVTLIFGVIPLLIGKKRIKLFLLSILFLLSGILLIKLSFYMNYGARLNASTLYAVFETNKTESFSFLSSYFTNSVLGLFILLSFLTLFFLILFLKVKFDITPILEFKTTSYSKLVIIAVVIFSLIVTYRFSEYNMFATSIKSYKEYSELKASIAKDLAKPYSENLTITKRDSANHTCVIIIGESTTKWHMGLYGYEKKTTPKLDVLKDSMLVFNDVIAPNVNTITSLDKILTFSDFFEPNKANNTSVVQLANMAGFETYWLSNQHVSGFNQSFASEIGFAANNKYFVSVDHYHKATSYDEKIFPKFKKILKEKHKRKVIFIHLIGTHIRYSDRYPEAFSYFKNEDDELFKVDKEKQAIKNHYDNAVLYNDYVVSSLINFLKVEHLNSSLVYFSDHGDDIYDVDSTIFGHSELHSTAPMYEIPFIIWYSSKQTKSLSGNYVNRKYNLEDFEHTFSDLLGIQHTLYDPKKSIINSDFVKKERFIKNGINYDIKKQEN